MADTDSGDKTEPATPKRLRDARKKGDVPKSQDIGTTFGLMLAVLVLWAAFGFTSGRLMELMDDTLSLVDEPFIDALRRLGADAIEAGLLISLMILLPIALLATLLEFLQTGPIVTIEKMKPKMSNMNPVEGVKRMFSMDNMFDLLKLLFKTTLLFTIGWFVVDASLPYLLLLPEQPPTSIGDAFLHVSIRLFGWVLVSFALVTAFDTAYQHHSFAKKMKMSMRDIKDEHKSMEGDPMIKRERMQLAQEWSQEGTNQAAKEASVLVVNPTHVAIAVQYDKESAPVPVVIGRGEDDVALEMRTAAEEAKVPILRNEILARKLLSDTDDGDAVPPALFDIVAEVILWARSVNERLEEEESLFAYDDPFADRKTAPGEDLTRYRHSQRTE